MPNRAKLLQLPSRSQFQAIVAYIRSHNCHFSTHAADLIEGLAYTGMRVGEARTLTWQSIDFERGMFLIHGTKTVESARAVPMIAPFRDLLVRIHRRTTARRFGLIFQVREATMSLKQACDHCGVLQLTHHDLRHLFVPPQAPSGRVLTGHMRSHSRWH